MSWVEVLTWGGPGGEIEKRVLDPIEERVCAQSKGLAEGQVFNQVMDPVYAQIYTQLGDHIRNQAQEALL